MGGFYGRKENKEEDEKENPQDYEERKWALEGAQGFHADFKGCGQESDEMYEGTAYRYPAYGEGGACECHGPAENQAVTRAR